MEGPRPEEKDEAAHQGGLPKVETNSGRAGTGGSSLPGAFGARHHLWCATATRLASRGCGNSAPHLDLVLRFRASRGSEEPWSSIYRPIPVLLGVSTLVERFAAFDRIPALALRQLLAERRN